ncbi:MAG: response regulator [Bryobacterales bacterium]|nr:response regulator [Bryobacterales bacterium]
MLAAARKANPRCAVILMTGRGSMETVMKATEGGAFDYIAKPFKLDHMLETLKRAEATLPYRRRRGDRNRRPAGVGNDRQFDGDG